MMIYSYFARLLLVLVIRNGEVLSVEIAKDERKAQNAGSREELETHPSL